MRDALAGIGGLDPIHLAVGADEVRLTTMDGVALDRRVPLRWVKGLVEVQLGADGLVPRDRGVPWAAA
jgi:hypothetical protein